MVQAKLQYIYGSKEQWKLLEDLEVTKSDGSVITIKSGMETDLSSVPRFLWSLFPPFGDFLNASLLHDYLYINKIGTRKEADLEMLRMSNILHKSKIDNYLRYYAVRLFGWIVYNRK